MSTRQLDEGVEGIAVVGVGARLPGARNLEEFWRNLKDGVESISHFTDEELLAAGVPPETLRDPDYVKASAIIEGADGFDAAFFGYSPREAEALDPQHRLFLECAWESLEDSGHDPATFKGAIGVFAGCFMNKYLATNLYTNEDFLRSPAAFFARIFNDKDFLATRVSYLLNLRGPALTIQTACSTSLVATHMACQSLLNYDCDMALVGGVALNVPLKSGYPAVDGGLFAPDGHCRVFDAKARGTVPGYGAAIVVLRRLSDALADRDDIRAVIRGTAINNDGSRKVGFTAPSVEAQAEVIAAAQSFAGVEPDSIGYIEAHGTGTPVGDPIEVAALTQAFRAHTERRGFCALGSVKANIGHLDAAAGVAGLLRAVLALKHKQIPPCLHFSSPNPKLELESSPFYVPTTPREWPRGEQPRRAGISSFGVGGTNAHVVLEEAPEPEESGPTRPWQLLALSARTRSALDTSMANLAGHLSAHPELSLADVAFTLQDGRRGLEHRRVLVCRDVQDAVRALEARDARRLLTATTPPGGKQVVFMFPGGGTQHPDMGLDIYRSEPLFRREVDRCMELLRPRLGFDPRRVQPHRDHLPTVLSSIFVTEYALAKLWMSWGLQPHAMIGHSLGEYAAACLAGVFSLEDALDLVVRRGELFARMPEGRMMTVQLSEKEVLPLLGKRLSLAAINAPDLTLVSGPETDIDALRQRLAARGVECRLVHIKVASHSSLVDPFLDEFKQTVSRYTLKPPRLPFISGVTGTWIRPEQATDPAYWADHLRRTVRFAEGIRELVAEPGRILLEVGPGNALTTLVGAQHLVPAPVALPSMRHPQEPQPDLAFLLTTVGRLWLAGVSLDWTAFHGEGRPRRVPLPTHPFERRRYWVEAAGSALPRPGKTDTIAQVHLLSWKRTLPPGPPEAAPEKRAVWLVLDDGSELGRRSAHRLTLLGHEVVRVRRGPAYQRIAGDEFALAPERPEDFEALCRELAAEGKVPSRAFHLWSLGTEEVEASARGLLALARTVGRRAPTGALRLLAVADGLTAVTGAEACTPGKAALIGACHAASLEAGVECRAVDVLATEAHGPAVDKLAGHLVTEACSPSEAALVAFRGRERWERVYEPTHLARSPGEDEALRRGGGYVFTGGLRGNNLLLAELLATTLEARLVLLEPVPFPAREKWEDWLATRGEADETSREIRRLGKLEELGAWFRVEEVDTRELEGAAARLAGRYEEIHGLVVGWGAEASAPAPGPREDEATALRRVAWELSLASRLAQEWHPTFCLLQSSTEAFLGHGAEAGAAMAAHQLATYAMAHDGEDGTAWLGVSWDGWRAPGPLSAEEGLTLLRRLLSRRVGGHVLVSAKGPAARLERLRHEDGPQRGEAPRLQDNAGAGDGHVAPRTERECQLVELWKELLGVERIGAEDDFFALGGNSLMVTQMTKRLRRTYAVNLTMRDLFDAPTIAELAALLELRQSGQQGRSEGGPDLASEATLDPSIRIEGLPARAPGPPRAVLLTGATGFLGAFLCAELLRQTQAQVYCLVRASGVEEGKQRVLQKLRSFGLLNSRTAERVMAVPGDLSEPLLGLSESAFQALAERVDAIYHCGAWVNFARPYRSLKATNVLGTQEVLRLATRARLKPVHHMSTLAVLAGAFVAGADSVREDEPLPPAIGHDTGYSQSKWVAEQVVAIARARGIPVSVYRPGVILGDSRTGVSNQEDYITKVIQGCIQLGLAPHRNYPLAVGTVDHVSQAIVALSLREPLLGRTFHTIDPVLRPWDEMFEHIRAFGYPVRSVPYDVWRHELTERARDDNALVPLLDLLADTPDRRTPRFDCRNLLEGLEGSGVVRPAIDAGFFATVLRYFIRIGGLPPVPPPSPGTEGPRSNPP